MSTRAVKLLLICFLCASSHVSAAGSAVPKAEEPRSEIGQSNAPSQKLSLGQAVMCERVENLTPIRSAVVFPVSSGQVACFTTFDPVPQPTLIYHRWFHRGELSTQTRLRLYPPKWATYSVIQLRETDKGPWHVEISDQNGHVFEVLRFSISD